MTKKYLFFFVMLFFLFSCQSEMDKLLGGSEPDADIIKKLRVYPKKKLYSRIMKLVEEGEWLKSDSSGKRKFLILFKTLALKKQGAASVIRIYEEFLKKKNLFTGLRPAFYSLSISNSRFVLDVVKKENFIEPRLILPDLIAVLALSPEKKVFQEFRRLYKGYDLAPEIFRRVFPNIPIRRFEQILDFSKKKFHDIAMKRLKKDWGLNEISNSNLKTIMKKIRFFIKNRAPMLVVLLVDHISNYKIGLLTTLSKNSKRYKKIRSDLKQLYYYMVQIRSRFKKRLENEQMLYASVVAKLYYQMRK